METERRQAISLITDLLPHIMGKLMERRPVSAGDWQLTIAQIRGIMAIARGECTMTEFADRLGIGMSAATGLVDRLVDCRVVERANDPADRRVVKVRLSPEGECAGKAYHDDQVKQMEETLQGISQERLDKIVEGLRLLSEAVSRGGVDCARMRAQGENAKLCENV